ncbi:hypothetical protein A946_00945 [Methylacidiphilum kamchatkense Kam1]|uniref:Uncharacterized protein n=2 Tax=Methylacidiphilum kamchatkense TaxID=431057 RepID=A0A0C1RMT5_9BACT|nr:hypothetical protein [Methylacidiphilum kamchatkense]KIE59312.1 hypothetical protein A946_00945 [Methylacidiphilum kamchatkense Kam1]QDQ42721.1 hypothetical protein kam1_1501 [Methylacidiphilum kamchatkense Kam1]
MVYFKIFFWLLSASFSYMLKKELPLFFYSMAIGALLGAVCWIIASTYTLLWNKKFRANPIHHFFCGLAALATTLFVICFFSLKYSKEVGKLIVFNWASKILKDSRWEDWTLAQSYEAIRVSGREKFLPPPQAQFVPLIDPYSRAIVANIYARNAAYDFSKNHPALSLIIRPDVSVPSRALLQDMNAFFQSSPQVYPVDRALKIVTYYLISILDSQMGRLVVLSRSILALLFVVFQLIPFSLIGWAAYQDIRVRT